MANIVDKADILPKIQGRTIELGCGDRKRRSDYVGVDILDYPGVDVVGDALDVLAYIPDGALAGVYSSHFFEHIDDISGLLGELARVVRPGGWLDIIVPHFSNPYYYSDLTHKSLYGLYTFSYWAVDHLLRRTVPTYQRQLWFEPVDVRLIFKSSPPFVGRYVLKRLLQKVVNLSTWTLELYEETLCYWLPCYEVDYRLVRMEKPGGPATRSKAISRWPP